MDLNQVKLSKGEWNSIEIPLSEHEKYISNLIIKGFDNPDIITNKSLSLASFLKITVDEKIHKYLYKCYFDKEMSRIYRVFNVSVNNDISIKTLNIKKKDKMRIDHMNRKIDDVKTNIFEFVVLDLITKLINYHSNDIRLMFKNKEILKIIVTLKKLMVLHISNVNIIFKGRILDLLTLIENSYFNSEIYFELLKHSHNILEDNAHLIKYRDDQLYCHQKDLFNHINNPNPKLVFYCAPTGTGKTLSPLGISCKYKVIFVCAARHVGLSFAKYAIDCDKKIAFAFGCDDSSGVKLHNSSAIDFIKNRKSGGIFRIDNTNGKKVEIMICDIKSYLSAMHYMMAFEEDTSNIVMYWDEPTITLDHSSHSIHSEINRIWQNNKIPNIVLSSATLPSVTELPVLVNSYKEQFNGNVYQIKSSDFTKSISILNKENKLCLPHNISCNFRELIENVDFCVNNKTLMRYMDLNEICKLLVFLINHEQISISDFNEYCYKNIDEYNIKNIKLFYLNQLISINKSGFDLIQTLNEQIKPLYKSTIYVTTKDAYTLKYGPTIFLTNDVNKLATFYYNESNINAQIIKELEDIILFNNNLSKTINELEKELEAILSSVNEDKVDSKFDNDINVRKLNSEINKYKSLIKTISLPNIFIPNKPEHFDYWNRTMKNVAINEDLFSGNINERIVEEIMTLKIDNIWKVLLMMGIGVFKNHSNKEYLAIMKKLADEQCLYLIIADSDYIYGTNYQFCTGYLSKDMNDISYEKLVQALGRVGRHNNKQNYSIRVRDNSLCDKLFKKPTHKPEVDKMNELFTIEF
jgi:hypothetical protein